MTAAPTNAEKIRRLPFVMALDAFNSTSCQLSVPGSIVRHCRQRLAQDGPGQAECLPLAITCLHVALRG